MAKKTTKQSRKDDPAQSAFKALQHVIDVTEKRQPKPHPKPQRTAYTPRKGHNM